MENKIKILVIGVMIAAITIGVIIVGIVFGGYSLYNHVEQKTSVDKTIQVDGVEEVQLKYNSDLQKIFKVQDKIKDIHLFLGKAYPIAIVENDQFFVFDTDSSGRRYVFVKKAPTPMPVPKGVRAAFTLECYENKVACVISGEIFDSPEGYGMIFHEFMHCQQWESCEPKLRQKLGVAQKAMDKKNYMWEINYPFPYNNSEFTKTYSLFLKALEENNYDDIFKYRSQLKQILSKDDFEYMVWQEWKEGFARFIENQIRGRLGLKENHYGIEKPFHRISFYVGGSRFIEFLSKQKPELLVDIEKLFYEMLDGELQKKDIGEENEPKRQRKDAKGT